MTWRLQIAKRAEKALARFPAKDQGKILAALAEMRSQPFAGDIARLTSNTSTAVEVLISRNSNRFGYADIKTTANRNPSSSPPPWTDSTGHAF